MCVCTCVCLCTRRVYVHAYKKVVTGRCKFLFFFVIYNPLKYDFTIVIYELLLYILYIVYLYYI